MRCKLVRSLSALMALSLAACVTHTEHASVQENHAGRVPDIQKIIGGKRIFSVASVTVGTEAQRAIAEYARTYGGSQQEIDRMVQEISSHVADVIYDQAADQEGFVLLADREKARSRAQVKVHCVVDALEMMPPSDGFFARLFSEPSHQFRADVTLRLDRQGQRMGARSGLGKVPVRVVDAGLDENGEPLDAPEVPVLYSWKRASEVAAEVAWGGLWRGLRDRAPTSRSRPAAGTAEQGQEETAVDASDS